ncbi:MAG: GNAT family N-acetyltransferase [Candidatus Symbiobacter sp.]|nr:GNAT family N-acetyltransferase [Candidatus Symbiobacter sp.]
MPLDSDMDREFFKCGNTYLDHLLRDHDCENTTNLKIYVALLDNHVIGYYAIGAQSRFINPNARSSQTLKKVDFGVVFIHGIAVRHDYRKKGIGKALMYHCFETSLEISKMLGVEALCLEAIDDELVKYYINRNFLRNAAYRKSKHHGIEMFIPINTIKVIVARAYRQATQPEMVPA